MKKILIVIYYLFSWFFVFSQKIEYRTSPALRDTVLKKLDLNNLRYGCVLSQNNSSMVTAVFFKIDSTDTILKQMCDLSNRFIFVNSEYEIPVIFDFDFYFSAINNQIENDIVTTIPKGPLGGFVCQFEPYFESGKVLRAFFDR